MKQKKLLTIMLLAFIVILGGCAKDDFQESIGVCPLVIATSPTDGQLSVPLNQVITVTFNETMNPATITGSSFKVDSTSPLAGTISYSGTTATFTPTNPLAANTTYIGRVTTDVKDLNGNALQEEYVWTFSTGLTLTPMIIATDPDANETGVALNKIVSANFNMPMNSATINSTTFTLKQGTTSIAGVVNYSGTTASFDPTNLLVANTIYTANISTGVTNVAGVAMATNYTWNFTTGTMLAPTVIATDPLNNATNVSLSKIVTATFDMPMNALTLTTSTFTLKQGGILLAGTVTYNGTTASFNPTDLLAPNTLYTAAITTGAKNLSGVGLATTYIWNFTTGTLNSPIVISTNPSNNSSGVAVNVTPTASFNMAMDPATINTNSFTLKQGTTNITGVVSYIGTTASFNPTADLMPNTTYTATITTLAKNTAGIGLSTDYIWSFTTLGGTGAPTVNLNTVARFGIIAGVGVSNNAGFSEIRNMDVGISPGVRSSITGFPPAIIVNGAIYASDDISPPGIPAMLIQAKQDLTDAYLFAEGATSPAPATVSGDIGGTTLAPGIYKTTSTLMIQSGNLTLDAQGDANAVWIFQIASNFTTVGGAGGSIILSGGAQAKNIFWQVGSSATIGDFTSFYGNVLALTSITMNSGAVATGRMLARNGSVVMTSTNIINKP